MSAQKKGVQGLQGEAICSEAGLPTTLQSSRVCMVFIVNAVSDRKYSLVILKNYTGKIGARTETKVDNGNDYNVETNFVDHFMKEIFIPIGRFDKILKAADQGSFG